MLLWLVKRFEPTADLPSELDTEQVVITARTNGRFTVDLSRGDGF